MNPIEDQVEDFGVKEEERFARVLRESVLGEKEFTRDALHSAVKELLEKHMKDDKPDPTSEDWFAELDGFTGTLRDLLSKTHSTLKRYARSSPAEEEFQGLKPSVKSLDEILTFSHKLAYSSFAPPGFEMGDQLGSFKAPAPQLQHFLVSKLHDFEEQYRAHKKRKSEHSITDQDSNPVSQKSSSEFEKESSDDQDSSTREGKGLEIEIEVPEEKERVEKESQAEEKLVDPGFGFVLNPDLEQSENSSPSSSVEKSSSED